ncbi:hypothetical protein [Nocardioides marmotae]|uniref:Integral membrane protein n=1 Tax=Nocardioides marmotae TaxID=2663857 RepID=A0A6I3JBG0_9ACTN|nr:hypothetical protein [Nocardioides marmotae]MCR6031841.1 hypothetical protein [Gordonia jinghuaiqii]MBC9732213.1 hypothetical protein [Nocardioides marmotae]MTB83335.1 hypothetical protein [Nocardioides marmotae]MTB95482.1 hypothetical protein [Nocardioides marmotae]QKE00915.1 hypothetical protein HPC71_07400 [Nocardioides marmotae]
MSVGQEAPAGSLVATEGWFLQHGLAYFVPEERSQARDALRPRKFLPAAVLTVLLAVGGGVLLAWASAELTAAPAFLLTIGVAGATAYALTALRTRPIVVWALRRGVGSLRTLLPMMSRALPLLLLFVTFLFINAEAWQLAASLSTGTLWLVVVLFGLLSVAFLLVRLPEEVDRTDDDVDEAFLLRACAGTPLEGECAALVADPTADPVSYATVSGFERWNLVLVLVVIQAVQVMLLSATVLVFFLIFGGLVMDVDVQSGWTGIRVADIGNLPYLDHVSVPLFQVSLFLAAFSNLYLTVSTVTDETYREQFFGSVLREMERAVGVRAVYLALRERVAGDAA